MEMSCPPQANRTHRTVVDRQAQHKTPI